MKLPRHVLIALAAAIPARGQTPSSTSAREPTTTASESGLTATLTSSASTSSSTSLEGCPTVTLTSNVCHSCATPDCVELVPLTNSCDCPSAIPTVFVDYPCESGCGGIGCAANYVFFTANCTTETSSASSGSSGTAPANSTASATGIGGLNSTASGITASGISTRSGGSATGTGTAAESSSSIAAAGRVRPFWMGLL
ncbi:hypothetical protein KVR01_007686 [Diaporthe batatas]|uniref:uncharacterized protein n=1 Tax=Diaporthe batatas TaxID=748121 RepID=UPI001D05092B|nr:uncharacterized protein KVR01_007686 [Diaporthe batatas]KAG8161921.1 hypothetical protein KVR01_007686 [Diaporthe batatas]